MSPSPRREDTWLECPKQRSCEWQDRQILQEGVSPLPHHWYLLPMGALVISHLPPPVLQIL